MGEFYIFFHVERKQMHASHCLHHVFAPSGAVSCERQTFEALLCFLTGLAAAMGFTYKLLDNVVFVRAKKGVVWCEFGSCSQMVGAGPTGTVLWHVFV